MTGGLDVVDASRRCAARFRELGMDNWSQKLTAAVDGAATGGELVMAVRWTLQEIEQSGIALPNDVSCLMKQIISEINKTGW